MAIEDYSFEQRSPEWIIACLGTPGGSGISKLLTSKGEPSGQRDAYINQLAAERFFGKPATGQFQSQHMTYGTENEDSSRALFELLYGYDVKTPGIVWKDNARRCHYSPDGLIGTNAILELKNPMAKTHVAYLEKKKLPTQYILQCQMGLYVCERDLCYFMSNCDGYAPLVIPVDRDEKLINKIHAAVMDADIEIRKIVEQLKEQDGMPF